MESISDIEDRKLSLSDPLVYLREYILGAQPEIRQKHRVQYPIARTEIVTERDNVAAQNLTRARARISGLNRLNPLTKPEINEAVDNLLIEASRLAYARANAEGILVPLYPPAAVRSLPEDKWQEVEALYLDCVGAEFASIDTA